MIPGFPDPFIENIGDVRMGLLQIPDLRVVVVLVNVGAEYIEFFVCRKHRKISLVPVKQQQAVLQFYQKTAVVNMCNLHISILR